MPRENDDLDDDLDHELDDDLDSNKKLDDETHADGEKANEDGSVTVNIEEDEENDDKSGKQTGEIESDEESDEEREAVRARRRQERADKRQKARERDERLRRELESERSARQQLEERLSIIERRGSENELAQLAEAKKQTENAYKHFKAQVQAATEKADGAAMAEATEKMIQARERHAQLINIEKAFNQKRSAPPPLNADLERHAKTFMTKHAWYKADGQDDDSVITRAIDNKLAAEGWDPKTEAYWEELDSRLKKYLPHRAKSATVQHNDTSDDKPKGSTTPRPKSIVAGSGRETAGSSAASSGNTFKLSAERVAAMKDAGVWDDPKQRNVMIKAYRDYDKANKGK